MAAWRKLSCKLLGHETIRAETVDLGDLDRELAEIDENLIRNELTALERGEHLARRKAIYEALHPETRQGGLPGAPGGGKQAKTETISGFAEDAAEKTGVTDRAVRYAVQIGEDITPEARDAIRATTVRRRLCVQVGNFPTCFQLPRCDDGSPPIVGMVTAVGVDDDLNLLRCDLKLSNPKALRFVRTARPGHGIFPRSRWRSPAGLRPTGRRVFAAPGPCWRQSPS